MLSHLRLLTKSERRNNESSDSVIRINRNVAPRFTSRGKLIESFAKTLKSFSQTLSLSILTSKVLRSLLTQECKSENVNKCNTIYNVKETSVILATFTQKNENDYN